jgi:sterol desaturase/sphingolipid hydroxylase (fatty acid hydroxylase superfamily)
LPIAPEIEMQCTLIVLMFGLAMLLVERLAPGRRFERVRGWHSRAILLNVVQAAVAFLSTTTWNRWFPEFALWHAGGFGLLPDALLGYVALTFIYYWWHRARHESAFLWRWLHQIHHSASRLEVMTSFYKHPVEIFINGLLSPAILYIFLGLNADSAALAFLLTGVAELFYHWNVRTPHWLGYLIQRPESHCVHHQRGRHRNNYSDLPIWDILFGTFENPRGQPGACGFGAEREQRLGAMLIGRNALARRRSNRRNELASEITS